MMKAKHIRKHSVLLLTCLLLIPTSIQLIHAIQQHEQTICSSDVIYHFHQQDIECELCHLQVKTFALLTKEIFSLNEFNEFFLIF